MSNRPWAVSHPSEKVATICDAHSNSLSESGYSIELSKRQCPIDGPDNLSAAFRRLLCTSRARQADPGLVSLENQVNVAWRLKSRASGTKPGCAGLEVAKADFANVAVVFNRQAIMKGP